MENYAKSYTNGASDFSATGAVWPGKFDGAPVEAGEQTMEEYNEENYFKLKQ